MGERAKGSCDDLVALVVRTMKDHDLQCQEIITSSGRPALPVCDCEEFCLPARAALKKAEGR